ncbi:MAG: LytTR family DNA-binding domain-containing protein [Bacteroidota bacterium]
MQLKYIAIDDEPPAIELIREYANKISFLDEVAVFDNCMDAIPSIQNNAIDLIFLDIQMPDIKGTDFLRSIKTNAAIIFTTAYKDYALDGYELGVKDYLLKPITFDKFLKSVNKIADDRKVLSVEPNLQHQNTNNTLDGYLLVNHEHSVIKIEYSDIKYIEGHKDYVKIHTESRKHPLLTLKTLKHLETILDGSTFSRIHKSYIINISKVESYRNGKVKIDDNHVPIAEAYMEGFKNKFMKGKI